MAGRHIPVKSFGKLEVSALNDFDLIISKMFRGDEVDVQDCLTLVKWRGGTLDLARLRERYEETASYDLRPERMMKNFQSLMDALEAKP